MDEKTAWENFAASGRVSDYLLYCEAKKTLSQSEFKNVVPEGFYDKNRGPDSQGTECWGK